MNITLVITGDYENERLCRRGKNKPNQTQFTLSSVEGVEPILSPALSAPKIPLCFVIHGRLIIIIDPAESRQALKNE